MIDPVKVKYANTTNPKSAFDLLELEEIFLRKSSDHDPEHLHKVEFFVILFITEGHGYHTIDFTDYKYEKGTLLTIRKDQIHKFSRGVETKGYLLLFTDDFLVSYLEPSENQKSLQLFNELLGSPKIQLSDKEYSEVRAIINRMEEEYRQNDDYTQSILRSELHILTTKLHRVKSKNKQIVADKKYLTAFIQFQNLVEANVTKSVKVSEYARMMAVSTKTLNTITKRIIDKNAKEFIDDIAVKQIKRLLINTSLPIKEIAYTSGFEETTNFYKYFKKHVQVTPEQFRDLF